MPPADEPTSAQAGPVQRLARLLRHEVGDLLQAVYSTVGILLERLPETLPLERGLLAHLKDRAELCRVELDGLVDLASALPPAKSRTDLRAALELAVGQARRQFSRLTIDLELAGPAVVRAEAAPLSAALGLLLLSLCQAASRQAAVRVGAGPGGVECLFCRDGAAATPEQLAWAAHPFASAQNALFGLALALTRRVAVAGGGDAFAANRPEGGVAVHLIFPSADG
jgi:signal transduction histidine kinase